MQLLFDHKALYHVLVLMLAFTLITPLAAQSADPDSVSAATSIVTDTVWSLEGSPYTVVGLLTVQPGANLIIMPGVEVRFNTDAGLLVQGNLLAEGTAAAPILLTGSITTPGS